MELIKINEIGVAESYNVDNSECDKYIELTQQGFKILVPIPPPSDLVLGEFECLVSDIVELESTYMERWIVKTDSEKVSAEIERLKSELAATDYQVVKSYEESLVGRETSYDMVEVAEFRQSLRDRINELETL